MCAGVRLGPYVCIGVSVVFLYHTCPYVYSGYTTHIQKHVSGYRFVAVAELSTLPDDKMVGYTYPRFVSVRNISRSR